MQLVLPIEDFTMNVTSDQGNLVMESSRPSKMCKRVYSPDPHAALQATFSQNYIKFLLPALMETITNRSDEDDAKEGNKIEMERRVKLQVDMALAVSADGFNWSHSLKQKLQTEITRISSQQAGPFIKQPKPYTKTQFDPMFNHENELISYDSVPKSLVFHAINLQNRISELPSGCIYDHNKTKSATLMIQQGGGRKKVHCKKNEEKEIHSRLMKLRGIIPGGEDMGTSDLFSELESYLVCLKLQVHVLRSLVPKP